MPVYYIEDVRKVYSLPLPTLAYYAQEVQQRMLVTDGIVLEHPATETFSPAENAEACLAKLIELSNADKHPEIVALDTLAPKASADPFELVRLTAVARIMLPKALIRVSAEAGAGIAALCCGAGANALAGGTPEFVQALGMRVIGFEDHHHKVNGCKGDGSCGHCTCGRHDH